MIDAEAAMASDPLTGLAIAAGCLALALAVGSAVIVVASLRRRWLLRRAGDPIDWPPTFAEIVAANGGRIPEPRTHESDRRKANYRHKLHCPKCGRFASKVEGYGDNVMSCKLHGLVARASTAVVVLVPATREAPVLRPRLLA